MKVSDIRTGMRVTLRNGETYYAMLNTGVSGVGRFDGNNILVHKVGTETGWMPLDAYDDNLEYHDNADDDFDSDWGDPESNWDIVKVEAADMPTHLFCSRCYKTIWERK